MNKRLATTAALLLTLAVTGCAADNSKPSAQKEGQKLTERAYAQQSAAVPYPADQLRSSLERTNLRDRLLRTNKPDAVGYVYLLSFGKPLGYYVIKGKVSSTQSQMTTDQLIVDHRLGHGEGWNSQVINAPGDDGSYGANESGIFFFLTSGVMVTTSLDYVWSDSPLPLHVPNLGAKR